MELSSVGYTGPLPAERVRGCDERLAELTRRVTDPFLADWLRLTHPL
jgi:hypothetical protein